MIRVVAFDGDDTLWHSEVEFIASQDRLREMVAPYVAGDELDARLLERERANLARFGYGVKGFVLSMIETAIEVSDGRIPATDIGEIVDWARDMLDHPVDLLDGVRDTVEALHGRYQLMIITKGDLAHQESKVARSELSELFWRIEIVSEKDPDTYRRIFDDHDIDAGHFVMIGNSVRSDVLPVIEAGGQGIHVPYHTTWELEHAEPDRTAAGYWELDHIAQVPELIARLDS
ncbi:MAG: HAD family hydrolase [Actinomycetota bacterium]